MVKAAADHTKDQTMRSQMPASSVLSLFLLITLQFLLSPSAQGQHMGDYPLTLKLENESLLNALKIIEVKTVFRFYYRKSEVRRVGGLSLPLGTRTVEKTLDELLKNTGITFRQLDNNILLESRLQNNLLVRGRVLGPDHRPAELATLQLLKGLDRQVISTAIADTGGRFSLVLKDPGDYLLKVKSWKTDSLVQHINISGDRVLQLPDIILNASSISLENVTINATRVLFTRTGDKLVLNVAGSVYEKGENALKLFRVIPGLQVTGREIVFRGTEGVTVYVDNRKMMMPADQLFAYLRAIPSESIKSYELSVVPGADHDAGNAGVVVNIVLKSAYRYGLSGNVGSGYWYNGAQNREGSAQVNYQEGKLNFSTGINYRRAPAFYRDGIWQEARDAGSFSKQTEHYREDYHALAYNAGLDYKIDLRQTVGVNYNQFANPGDIGNTTQTDADYFSGSATSAIDSSWHTLKSTDFHYVNQMANVFYRNKLDTTGSKLDMGYSFVHYGLRDPSSIETTFKNSSGMAFPPGDSLFTKTKGNSTIHVINVDLEKHLGSATIWNAGGKYTASETDYTMDYRLGLNEQSALDPTRSNRFLYRENLIAFYSTLSHSFDNWQLKAGLRTEQTDYSGRSVSSGQTLGRSQWNFFPSVYLSKKINDHHDLSFSYARRISRPGFRQLNPFVSYTSVQNVQQGNPELRPYFSNNLQLEYWFNRRYSLTAGYQNAIHAIETRVTSAGPLIISKDENISDNSNVFLSLYAPLKLTAWWEFNTSTTLRYNTVEVYSKPALRRSKYSQFLWATNQFHLPGKYFIEISGLISRNNFSGIYDQRNTGKLDISVKKTFLRDRLSSSLELQDPFHLFKPGSYIDNGNLIRSSIRNRVDWARYAGIWLSYSFSSGRKQGTREQVDAAGNEARKRL